MGFLWTHFQAESVSISRVLSPALAGDGHFARTPVTRRLMHPTRELGGPPHRSPIRACSKQGLASRYVTTPLVGSYPTFSPLPMTPAKNSIPAICHGRCRFCATFRRITPPGRYPVLCPLELGLSSDERLTAPTRDHPTHSPHPHYTPFSPHNPAPDPHPEHHQQTEPEPPPIPLSPLSFEKSATPGEGFMSLPAHYPQATASSTT